MVLFQPYNIYCIKRIKKTKQSYVIYQYIKRKPKSFCLIALVLLQSVSYEVFINATRLEAAEMVGEISLLFFGRVTQ